jgi:predicted enzyme related to lactoylglutathione lyase
MLTNLPFGGKAMNGTATIPGIINIGQISINVQDLERATAFYRDVLGLRFLFAVSGLAFFDCGGVRLMLGRAEAQEFDHPSSILYFRVPDINAGHQRLVEQRVQIVASPRLIAAMGTYDLWMSAFRDSEGNVHQLMNEVPKGG